MADFLKMLSQFATGGEVGLGAGTGEFTQDIAKFEAPKPTGKSGRAVDPAKKLVQDLRQIGVATADGPALDLLTVAQERGNDLAANNAVLVDWDNLSPLDFQQKYGEQVFNEVAAFSVGGASVRRKAATTRDADQHIADAIMGFGSGAVQGAVGINQAVLQTIPIAGPVTPWLATKNAELGEALHNATSSQETPELGKLRYVDALRTELDNQDSENQYQTDKEKDGSFVAGLRRIGRDIAGGLNRLGEDPAMLEAGIAEGTGSLMLGGPASKGLATAAKSVNRVISPTIGRTAETMIEKAAFPVTIAAMEGGGAANQTIQEVMAMPEEELMKLPAYQELLTSMDPAAARRQIADKAGALSGVIAAPIAAATAKLVEGFEKAPLSAANPSSIIGNTVREFTEETIQSGAGEFASNAGQKLAGTNPDGSLVEGVGSAAIQGGIFGGATPAVTQGPSVALSTAAKAAGIALKYPVNAIRSRAERFKSELEAESSVSTEQLTPVVQQATEQAPQVAEALRTIAVEKGVSGEEVDAYIARVEQASQTIPEDLQGLPTELRGKIGQVAGQMGRVPNRFETLLVMAQAATDEDASQEERTAAGAFILKSAVNNKKLFTEDLPAYLDNIPHDREEAKTFAAYASVLRSIDQNPAVQQAIKWAETEMSMPDQDLSRVNLNDDAGQQIVNNAVDIATVAPQAVNANVANQILLQADEGTLQLTPERRRILRSAVSLLNSARVFAAQNRAPEAIDLEGLDAELEVTQPRDELMDFVGRQIETEGGAKAHQLSLIQHASGINQSIASGDMAGAKRKAQILGRFARSMINKVGAFNQAIANGDRKKVAYQSLGRDGEWLPNDQYFSVFFNPGSEPSEKIARKVYAEALAVAELANEYAGQFGFQKVQVPALALVNREENRGSSTPASSEPAGATTRQPSVEIQEELPLPPTQPTRVRDVTTPAVETDVAETTDQTENTQSVTQVAEPVQEQVSNPVPASVEEEVTVPDQAQPEENADTPVRVVSQEITLEPVAEEVLVAKTITEAFPLLVQPAGRNFFQKAFRMSAETKSRMRGLVDPLRSFYRMMLRPNELEGFMGDQEFTDVTLNDLDNFKRLLVIGNDIMNLLDQRLISVVDKPINKKSKETTLDRLNAGDELFIRTRDKRLLNLLDKVGSDYQYNPELVQTAIIAGLDWVLNAVERSAPMTQRDVAELMGIKEEEAGPYVDTFNEGISLDMAKRGLAESIRKFWDVEANKDARDGFAKGIPEAMAAEILHGLSDVGLIRTGIEKFPGVTLKTFGRVWFDNRSDEIENLVRGLYPVSELFADMALIDRQTESYSIGKPVTELDQTQLRNPMVKTSKQQKAALKNVQNTPYLPNHMVYDFIEAMGEEAFVTLLGKRPYKKGDLKKEHTDVGLNVMHWKSVKGLQTQLVNSFQNVTKQMAQVKRHGENAATYYKHHINKLGRLQMAGLSNPQSDKLAREIFMSTKSTLDLTNEADFLKFMVTIGQGIGLKTEKEFRFDIAKKVGAAVFAEDGELRPLVLELKTWLNSKGAIPTSTIDLLTKANLSMHGLHSLLEVARFENVRDTGNGGGLVEFETFVYLEADGKTNGPINSMLLLASGAITGDWLKQIAKGGAFFGKLGRTLNQHVKSDSKDLYEEGSDRTQIKVADLGKRIAKSNPKAHEMFLQFQYLLAGLDIKNVELNAQTGEMKIHRGLTKNPLTITIYGSGTKGIAGNVADELINVLYAKISESMVPGAKPVGDLVYGPNGNAEFFADLSDLTSKTVKYVEEKDSYYVAGQGRDLPPLDQNFKLSPEQYKTLRDNVLLFLVEPMTDAIDDTVTDYVKVTKTAIQEATQLQSIILKGMFLREVAARIALMKSDPEKYDYSGDEFLSQTELDDIRNNLLPFSPIINTGTQGYFLSGGEKSDLFSIQDDDGNDIPIVINGQKITYPEAFARSLTGDFSTAAYTYGATLAGVSAIPTTVVGSGDGQMMLNFLSENPEAAARVLHVFDGLNMPASEIDAYSQGINESVYKTWTTDANVVRAVAESFAEFLRNRPVEHLFPGAESNPFQDQALLEIKRALHNKFNVENEDDISPDAAMRYMERVLVRLNDAADDIDARRKLYTEFDLSVDQMASAESPFVNNGTIYLPDDASLDDIAELMDYRRQEILSEIKAKRENAEAVQREGDLTKEAITKVGVIDESGARTVQAKELPRLFKGMRSMLTPTQKEMFRQAANLLEGSGYQIVFGKPSELDAWEQIYNADRFVPGSNSHYGKTDPVAKVITVSSSSPETIVHELVHAATFDKVNAFYAAPELLTKEEREAVARIEGLMKEWLQLSYDQDYAAGYDARRKAENAIISKMPDNNPTAPAVNEFMAWVLGNQHLAELASKTKVKSPLFRIVGDMLAALKSLLWGAPNKGARVGDNILSNLRFNTRVLMATPTRVELLKQDFAAVALFQSNTFGNNHRLSELRQRFNNKIVSWMNEGISDPRILLGQHVRRTQEVEDAKNAAEDIARVFAYHFPGLGSMQAYSTFGAIQQALMTEVGFNTNALTRVEELYTHAIKELKVEDFRENNDPNDQQDQAWAQAKYNAIEGVFITRTDKHGRSSLMSSFLALAMTDEQFRTILSKMDKPKSERDDARTFDALLENHSTAMMDRLSIRLAGENSTDTNVRAALDSLVNSMIDNVGDQRSFIEQRTESGFDKIEQRLATAIQNKSEEYRLKSEAVLQSNRSLPVRAAAGLVNLAATAINESAAREASLGITSWFNKHKGFETLRSLVNDVTGRTRENSAVFDMISKVRAEVQQTRQQFRDELPKKLASMFKREVSAEQWTAMFKALGKTDLATLAGRYGISGAIELVNNPTRLNSEILTLERSIQTADPRRFVSLQAKSKQLAHYMMTGEHGSKLLRNAEAIARLLGEPNTSGVVSAPAAQLVDDIDHLVTLYAIQNIDEGTRNTLTDLGTTESDGIVFVTNYLVGQRVDELAKARASTVALFNHYKGHIPSEAQQGGSLIIASDSEHARLVTRGYTKLSTYNGSSADRVLGRRSYYFAPVSGTAPFSQGVLQTVHQTASGVDPETGYTVGEVMAGRIEDVQIVRLIDRQIAQQSQTNENLLPVFDDAGKIVAFERAADPSKLVQLNRNQDLSAMIGVWRGRQVEELLAQEVNKQLVDNLHEIYKEGARQRRTSEFVNIANLNSRTDDPILIEAAKLIPNQSRDYIKSVFGPDEFWVRKDMLLDTFGARQASVGDLFAGGHTRWNPKVTKKFETIVAGMPFMGRNGYKILVGAEKNIQEFVGNAKTLIVVKSVVVPMANMISNMFQLLNRGVPLRAVLEGVGKKTSEINFYVKARHREIGLEADLRASKGRNDLVAIRKLENQIQSLHDSYRRMSIWPLIEAGEFSAISNGQVTAEDLALADGKWTDWIERKVSELPDGLKTTARYALVTRDTALFQGLARSVQYGDFVAKAILYDDLTGRKKTDRNAAVAQVNEAFVNYNRLAGRGRQYLESVGLLWFYNYKLRIMKEAAHMLRHNPLRSLMMVAAPGLPVIGDIGSPVTDNFVAILNDGKLDYSIGPSMGLHSFSLNPWLNLAR